MTVKLLTRMAGPDGNHPPGSVLVLPDEVARELVQKRYAECLDKAPKKAVRRK